MVRLRTIFYCGHESRYGFAHLEPLLRSQTIRVETVVLANYQRWTQFHAKLTGIPLSNSLLSDWAFRRRCKVVRRTISNLSTANIRIVFDVNDPEEVEHASKYDLVVCAAFPQIFNSALVCAPKLRAINFHPSYLPRCRGAHPVYWTIASVEPCGGVSCHVMEKTIDTGPLIAQRRIDFDKLSITYEELYSLVEAETPLLCNHVETFFAEHRAETPQQGRPTYFRNEREEDRRILFADENLEKISAKIRAGRAFVLSHSGWKLLLAPPVSISETPNHRGAPGEIVEVGPDRIVVAGQNGYLTCRYWLASESGFVRRALRKLLLAPSTRARPLRAKETLN